MRICSFLPAATEMLFALGVGDDIVGVSHECDYPSVALSLPKVTTSLIDPQRLTSAEIDASVSRAFVEGRSTYRVEVDVLADARPDLIVTQDLCLVCAIGGTEVRQAATALDPPPRVLTLEPHSVSDVIGCVRTLGEAVGVADRAEQLASALEARIAVVWASTASAARPRVVCLEWLDPPWIAGHWMPEAVQLAGGVDVLARAGEPSRRATWDEIAEAAPDVAIVMPCGFSVERTLAEIGVLEGIPQLSRVTAFTSGRACVVDGSSYFSRPGPRIVDGVEMLGAIIHPELFPGLPSAGPWLRVETRGGRPELHFSHGSVSPSRI
jgi:iron complex transport system substrate-binding protein